MLCDFIDEVRLLILKFYIVISKSLAFCVFAYSFELARKIQIATLVLQDIAGFNLKKFNYDLELACFGH